MPFLQKQPKLSLQKNFYCGSLDEVYTDLFAFQIVPSSTANKFTLWNFLCLFNHLGSGCCFTWNGSWWSLLFIFLHFCSLLFIFIHFLFFILFIIVHSWLLSVRFDLHQTRLETLPKIIVSNRKCLFSKNSQNWDFKKQIVQFHSGE